MAEEDRVAASVSMRGIHLGEFQGLAPIGKRVEDKAIEIFHVSGGKIVEHWRDGDDPTDFLPQPGVPEFPTCVTPSRSPVVSRAAKLLGYRF